MSQSDYNIGANPSGLNMRTEINQIFDSILTNNSGSTAPTVTKAFMMWVDTSNATYYYLKMRNHDNTAWVTLGIYTVATKAYTSYVEGTVKLTGNQTIDGVKTFSSSPIVPTPTTGTQAVNKDYADLKQANLGFTPVQQGTGIGQLGSAVKIGWAGTRTKITIDATDMGNIVMDNDIGVANSSLVKTALNATGTAPIYACRAWVNFNGTGTVAIRASGNVSSITDNGTGDYTVNFTAAMPDANYAWDGTVQGDAVGFSRSAFSHTADVNTTTSFKVKTGYSSSGSSALIDFPTVSVTVFR